MRFRYDVKEEEIWMKKECNAQKTYTIVLRRGWRVLRRISNAFANADSAREFAAMCNRYKLDPIHLDCLLADNT